MLIGKAPDIISSEITPEGLFWSRRAFIAAAGGMLVAASPLAALAERGTGGEDQGEDKLTPFKDVTTYNNFYEFGTSKDDPSHNAGTLRPHPWSVSVEGEVQKPKTYDIDDLTKRFP